MSALSIARKALAQLSKGVDCGCAPCRGDCRSQEALQIELDERCDIASAALKAIGEAPASTVRCDEPDDIFTRVTRDMARSS